ncbi:hypothetical protein KQX54_007479 [Cotesia glomerata]|uniref:Uncharacterized protein n=1 Tax=Cotesia glomerata TaxID=32391 RepID=A0AAV7IXK3_COTGL|nr:hypothetical protein KQX54_007479 [Cotesia glomerata]
MEFKYRPQEMRIDPISQITRHTNALEKRLNRFPIISTIGVISQLGCQFLTLFNQLCHPDRNERDLIPGPPFLSLGCVVARGNVIFIQRDGYKRAREGMSVACFRRNQTKVP